MATARKKKPKDKKKGYEPFKSWDEKYFWDWCKELSIYGGIIEAVYEPYPFILTEGLYNKYTVEEKLKTKTRFIDKEQALLRPSQYTPDFLIFWNDHMRNKLFQVLNEGKEITSFFVGHQEDHNAFSLVEIKPIFNFQSKETIFINNQKIVWEKYEKFVNLTKIEELFPVTFTPRSYLLTPTGKRRKLKWKDKKIEAFLK